MAILGNLGKNVGAFLGLNSSMPNYEVPQEDQRLAQQTSEINNQSKAIRGSIPDRSRDLGNIASGQAKRNLAEQMTGLRGQASQRGLLYSGLRQGAEQGLRADTASQIAAQKAQINSGLENEAYGAENQALDAEMMKRQADMQREQLAYNAALQRAQLRQQSGSGLFGSVGLVRDALGG